MQKIITLLCLLVLSSSIFAQQLDYHQGQIIVQLDEGIDGHDWVKSFKDTQEQNSGLIVNKQLSQAANIYLLDFDFTRIHENLMLRMLQQEI